MEATNTLKKQVKVTPEFLSDIPHGVKLLLGEFEKETGHRDPFYYLKYLGNDLDDSLYTLMISAEKERKVYCTSSLNEETTEQAIKFMKLNPHLNLRYDISGYMVDDFIKDRITMVFNVL